MRVSCDISDIKKSRCDLLCVLLTKEDPAPADLDKLLKGQIAELRRRKHFHSEALEKGTFVPHPPQKFARVLLIGLGRSSEVTLDCIRRAGGAAGQAAMGQVVTLWPKQLPAALDVGGAAQAFVEGFILGGYRDLRFRSDGAGKQEVPKLTLSVSQERQLAKMRAGAGRGRLLAELQNHCRDLSGAPGNVLTPTALANEARKLARKHGLKISVFDRRQIERMKMEAFLAVARGSAEPPKLIRLDYAPKGRARKRVVLVGKGITFDTGGISIKPGENMFEMRQDMTGAAVVICAMAALAQLRPSLAVTALIPTCENMPGSRAYKPGDVLTTSIGKTIEIINTDAEGRLLLADALGHATKLKPDYLIDVATLTGAATVALGNVGAAILATSDMLVEKFTAASATTAEKIWRLPLWEEYEQQIKSNIADMVNSGGRPAGTITAALILKKFTGGIPWLHLDIAAVDYEYRGTEITPKGPSGFGLRTVVEALTNL